MPTIKQAALHAIENLPDDVDYDGIMEAIYVQHKIAKGVNDFDGRKFVTREHVKKWTFRTLKSLDEFLLEVK